MSCPEHTYLGDSELTMSMFVKSLNGRSVSCYALVCKFVYIVLHLQYEGECRVNEMSETQYPLASAYLS